MPENVRSKLMHELQRLSIDAYLALPASTKSFVIVGGEASISTDTTEYLVNTKGVPVANIRRISGADRYATSLAVNNYMRASGSPVS